MIIDFLLKVILVSLKTMSAVYNIIHGWIDGKTYHVPFKTQKEMYQNVVIFRRQMYVTLEKHEQKDNIHILDVSISSLSARLHPYFLKSFFIVAPGYDRSNTTINERFLFNKGRSVWLIIHSPLIPELLSIGFSDEQGKSTSIPIIQPPHAIVQTRRTI